MYSNLHTHTVYSDGKDTMEEIITAAMAAGLDSIGISDHSHTPCDESYCMKKDSYPQYLQDVMRLKAQYASRIPVYAGLELDAMSRVDTAGLDYVIASVHYLDCGVEICPLDESPAVQKACLDAHFQSDALAMADSYYKLLVSHVKNTKPTFVGHFDIIDKFSLMPTEDPAYRVLALSALEQVICLCPYLEVNTGIMARGLKNAPYPADFLLEAAREMGMRPVLSSDCHRKEKLIFAFDKAVALLKSKGFDGIWVFNGTSFQKQAI